MLRLLIAAALSLVAGAALAETPDHFINNVTPNDCSVSITTGGTAQNLNLPTNPALIHGGVFSNIDAAAGTGEPVWFSFTGTAAASTAASYPLSAPTATTFTGLTSFFIPFGLNHAISVVAATTGHKISCTYW